MSKAEHKRLVHRNATIGHQVGSIFDANAEEVPGGRFAEVGVWSRLRRWLDEEQVAGGGCRAPAQPSVGEAGSLPATATKNTAPSGQQKQERGGRGFRREPRASLRALCALGCGHLDPFPARYIITGI